MPKITDKFLKKNVPTPKVVSKPPTPSIPTTPPAVPPGTYVTGYTGYQVPPQKVTVTGYTGYQVPQAAGQYGAYYQRGQRPGQEQPPVGVTKDIVESSAWAYPRAYVPYKWHGSGWATGGRIEEGLRRLGAGYTPRESKAAAPVLTKADYDYHAARGSWQALSYGVKPGMISSAVARHFPVGPLGYKNPEEFLKDIGYEYIGGGMWLPSKPTDLGGGGTYYAPHSRRYGGGGGGTRGGYGGGGARMVMWRIGL